MTGRGGATYAVGDLQGCFATFEALLSRIAFDPARDRLWLAGDLVNRGPRSVDVLRWVRDHAACATAVLGNHDLHLLACAAGVRTPKPSDTFTDVLAAPDRDALLDWVRHQPLIVREGDRVLVHAGIKPAWTVDEAERRARALERSLRGDDWPEAIAAIYRRGTLAYDDASALTRMRLCGVDGEPVYDFAGEPADAPPGQIPWFRVPGRRAVDHTIVFGHWAALGLLIEPNLIAVDTGCVWGGALTAVRLDDRAVFSEPSRD
ncbi:MAG: symmetrical bis(5'-nucleosyl)-tetraphosphatase [Deltaproteobacteria bacterium]|nr:MAG: symmetrical bis(5'-nucleosyl)-tetraphosphatase [Deltaproteobacteria bacterium]